jgi:hypothetical protein
MPSRDRQGGYCNCADCRPKVWKQRRGDAGRSGMKPDPVDLGDGFWDQVRADGELRDLERKTRR